MKKNNLREIPEAVQLAYAERLTYFKNAKIYLQKENIPKSVEMTQQYLNAVAAYNGVTEKELHPDLFKDDGHIAEVLLISYAYWDLAKAYDRSENFADETERLLKQFVLFTLGFKFQYNHSIMIRKYIRLNKAVNRPAFNNAYDKLYVKIKGCFVATYAFDEKHFVVDELRLFRDQALDKFELGKKFIDKYYQYSPLFIIKLEGHPLSNLFRYLVARPLLFLLYLVVLFMRKLFHVF